MNNNFLKIGLPIVSIIFIIFYITTSYIKPSVKKTITIATGNKNGNYYKMALEYKKLLKEQNVEVKIINTAGSVENIQLINDKKADFAFVQSGILKNNENILSLASLYYEPLWIFYKDDSFDADYVIQLIGKKISIGTKGSGTFYLSKQILDINKIDKTNSEIMNFSTKIGKEKLLNGEINALFIVASANFKEVQELLQNPNINLLNIKRSYAYDSKYSFLNGIILHEGTVNLYMNLPNEDKKLLTTTANLIVSKDIPDELVRLVLKQSKKIHSKKGIFEKEFQFPNLNNLDGTIHDEAKKYITHGDSWLEDIFPFWIASNIDRLKILIIPLLTLMIPLMKGVVPLYRLTMRSKIYRWYEELNQIDTNIDDYSKKELKKAIQELKKLKNDIQEYTKVPLAYMGEYYNLILHVDLVFNKIKNIIQQKDKNAS